MSVIQNSRKPAIKRPIPDGFISLNKNTVYVNAVAGKEIGLTAEKGVVFDTHYSSPMIGIQDSVEGYYRGFTPAMSGDGASINSPQEFREGCKTGRYEIMRSKVDNRGVTWYFLKKYA